MPSKPFYVRTVPTEVNQNYRPAPNRGGPDALANNYGVVFPFPTDYHLRKDLTQRIDYQINSKHRLTGRTIEDWGLYVLPTNFPAFTWTRVRFNIHAVFEETGEVRQHLGNKNSSRVSASPIGRSLRACSRNLTRVLAH